MARPCTICPHAERKAIDSAVLTGESFRNIAKQHGISAAALFRHKAHIPAKLAKAHEAKEVAAADDLLKEVRALRSKSYSILLAAEKAGDLRTALAGIREARGCLELLARLVGELNDAPQVTLAVSAEWVSVRGVLLEALRPYPDARVAVASRLLTIEGGARAGN